MEYMGAQVIKGTCKIPSTFFRYMIRHRAWSYIYIVFTMAHSIGALPLPLDIYHKHRSSAFTIVHGPTISKKHLSTETYPNTRPTLQPNLEIVSLCWFALGHHPGMTATDISLASCARTMWERGKRPEAARSWRLSRYLRWSADSVPMYGSHLIFFVMPFEVSMTTASPTIIAVEQLQTCAETLRNTTCTFSANVFYRYFTHRNWRIYINRRRSKAF